MSYSGGHLNPVVTLAMTIVRRLPLKLAPLYVVAQLLGALMGAGLAKVYKVLVLVITARKDRETSSFNWRASSCFSVIFVVAW